MLPGIAGVSGKRGYIDMEVYIDMEMMKYQQFCLILVPL